MSKVSCHYCVLPFNAVRVQPGREYFCCSGCALASRVPVDEDGKFPVNPPLVAAMAVGFLFFNQLLFWLLETLLVREGRLAVAGRFEAASLALGGIAWLALVVIQWRLGARRWIDAAVVVLTAGLLANGGVSGSPACAAGAGFGLLAWSARGFLKKKTPDKTADGG